MSLAVRISDGKPAKWPKAPYATGTDKARFWCVWRGQHFTLLSLSDHLRKKVNPTGDNYLLLDARYQTHLAPKSEVAISRRIG